MPFSGTGISCATKAARTASAMLSVLCAAAAAFAACTNAVADASSPAHGSPVLHGRSSATGCSKCRNAAIIANAGDVQLHTIRRTASLNSTMHCDAKDETSWVDSLVSNAFPSASLSCQRIRVAGWTQECIPVREITMAVPHNLCTPALLCSERCTTLSHPRAPGLVQRVMSEMM